MQWYQRTLQAAAGKVVTFGTLLCDKKRTVQTKLDSVTVVSLRSLRAAEEKVLLSKKTLLCDERTVHKKLDSRVDSSGLYYSGVILFKTIRKSSLPQTQKAVKNSLKVVTLSITGSGEVQIESRHFLDHWQQ